VSWLKSLEWLAKLPSWYRARAASWALAAAAGIVLLVVVVSCWQRIQLGVELTDEAFPTALAYRFALGDRPFLDEMAAGQTPAVFLWPLVWLYVKIAGSSHGIVLFARCLFFAFGAGTAGVVFWVLRRYLLWPAALIVALLCVVYVPFTIAAPNYNALGMDFFTMGSFLCLRAATEASFRRPAYWAGICLGLGVLAYPTYAPAVLLLVGCTALTRSSGRLASSALVIGGGLTVVLLVAPVFLRAGLGAVHASFAYAASITPRPKLKLVEVMLDWWKGSPVTALLVPALAVGVAGLRRQPQWALWCAPLAAFGAASAFGESTYTSTLLVILYTGLFAPVWLLVVGDSPFLRAAFRVIWWPSVLAGLLTGYSSSNGATNSGLGLFPAAILGITALALAADQGWTAWKAAPMTRSVVLAGPTIFLLFVLLRWCTNVYRDRPLAELNVRTTFGPYAGLKTTKDKVDFMRVLQADIQAHESTDGRLVVYYEMPGAYLFSRMRPGINTVWPAAYVGSEQVYRSFQRMNTGQGVAIRLKALGAPPGQVVPLERAIEDPGRLIRDAPSYAVYALPPPVKQ
jgi:hypothetical protein